MDGGVHHADHAGDVEHRHHTQADIFSRSIAPHLAGAGVVHRPAVQVHAAFGQAGGAAGVGQDGQIVVARQVRAGFAALGHQFVPGMALAIGQRRQRVARQQPVAPGRGHVGLGALGVEGVGELGHDQVRQPLARAQLGAGLGPLASQVAGGDGNAGVWVGDVVLELLGPVHRVYRHHHGVGAQDGEMRDHQLRAVLHAQRDAVALLDTQRLQARGQCQRLLQQFGVAQAVAKELQRGLVGEALGADRQVVPQRGGHRRQGVRNPLGPESVMRLMFSQLQLHEEKPLA